MTEDAGGVRAALSIRSAIAGIEPLVADASGASAAGFRLSGRDAHGRAVLEVSDGPEVESWALLLLDPTPGVHGADAGIRRREVVVDGWRFEVELEPARRAALRARATRDREAVGRGGRTEVRAIIPGRVVSVSVLDGDDVEVGRQLVVIEAMKMQNELRAPRAGRIERVAVTAGQTIEVGDLLVVIG